MKKSRSCWAPPRPCRPWSTIAADLIQLSQPLLPLIGNAQDYLWKAWQGGESILFEGAQATLLDIDHGTYPYVTSSNCSIGGLFTGTGLPPKALDHVLGVAKAYTTRVGAGPMPSELLDATGERLRQVGREFGTTTGRPRRCGWFDAVITRHACRTNGADGLGIMKLDVMDGFDGSGHGGGLPGRRRRRERPAALLRLRLGPGPAGGQAVQGLVRPHPGHHRRQGTSPPRPGTTWPPCATRWRPPWPT
jgi:hypothetical protein